jgi:tRNA(fMet)-specific endonuclease VapC
MKFLLDTNICIYIIKQKPPEVLQKFNRYHVGDIGISSITIAELEYGIQKSKSSEKNREALTQFLLPLTIADFDVSAATMYGIIRSTLEKQGNPIGSLDTLIAAHALSLQVSLITNNIKEFNRVPNLNLENWVS